ncbi:VanW family protein [Natranaerofaba carboxydovora]|uniref:VanW family protein n=1 Tax=Natranaerofaba carboxydovora TaxID=2742683 RepID=UPI001F139D77|nr:VanW family protein [Natranaerofaba carboxydovora]UMZ73428.1 Vancomycin B-type resistance protein VanW [Natranaerofaba carboxydovora]
MKQPIKRSELRITLGKCYYKFKRYLQWCFSGERWAKTYNNEVLSEKVFEHQTPLLRKLKNVDMWMQYNKVENLKIATQKINKIVINPGETFSFWRLIGKPSKRNGYRTGMVLSYGQIIEGIGGGLCQLSNLIYWMTLHTPLTIKERYRHTYDVFPDANRVLPFGSGATCSYNYIDLQICNETDQSYQLIVYLTDDYLVGEWRSETEPCHSYEVYEKDHWITHEYWGGYVRHNIIHRKVYNLQGELIDDEYVTENHAIMMYQPYLESGY